MRLHRLMALSAVCAGLALSSRASADDGRSSTLTETSAFYMALFNGQRLVSDSGYYHLEMQSDGNLVEYAGCGTGSAVWATNTVNRVTDPGPSWNTWAVLQQDGNFVEYGPVDLGYFSPGPVLFASNTVNSDNSTQLRLQDDGNLVIYAGESAGVALPNGAEVHGREPNEGCNGDSSITTVWSNLAPSSGGTYLAGFNYDLGECGNWCASKPDCVAFYSATSEDPFYAEGDSCELYSSTPTLVPQESTSIWTFAVGLVIKAPPNGN
jgi:hypothetical protein